MPNAEGEGTEGGATVAALMSTVSGKTRSELATPAQALLDRFGPGVQEEESIAMEVAALKESGRTAGGGGVKAAMAPSKRARSALVGTQPTKEDAIALIDGIKNGVVAPKVKEMRDLLVVHSLYYVFLIAAGVVVNVSPTAATAIGTLGLGSLGVGANYNNLQSAVDKYVSDRRNLLSSVEQLDALEGYGKKDFPQGVQKAYDAAMTLLNSLVQQPAQKA